MHTAEKLQAAANLSSFKNWSIIGIEIANQNQTYWLRLKILVLFEIIGETLLDQSVFTMSKQSRSPNP